MPRTEPVTGRTTARRAVPNGKYPPWLQHALGKIRRFYLVHLEKDYVEAALALRREECARCGACCRLLHRCAWIAPAPDGLPGCRIYGLRPGNCRIFPIDDLDILDRNLNEPHRPCGYTFVDGPLPAPGRRLPTPLRRLLFPNHRSGASPRAF